MTMEHQQTGQRIEGLFSQLKSAEISGQRLFNIMFRSLRDNHSSEQNLNNDVLAQK